MSDAPSTTGAVSFRTTIQLNGRTATGIEVPADVVGALGSSRRPAVRATIAGYTYSRQRRFVDSIEGAKAAETRRRRIEQAVSDLRAGKG